MRRDETQIEHIVSEIAFIQRTVGSITRERFLENELLQHAVCMSLITIGECANHLSDAFKENHAQIEWIQVVAVRNIAAHGYWQLNMEHIWQAVFKDIPQLKSFFNEIGD